MTEFAFPSEYDDRCRFTLETALAHMPMYKAWRRFDPGPGHTVDERYAALPVMTKQHIREHFPAGLLLPDRDLNDGLRNGHVEYVQTSGTTDDRVTLLWHQPWWDASERASWKLNRHAACHATGTHREVVVASPRCVGPPRPDDSPLSVRQRTLGRLLFVNEKPDVGLWTDGDVARMASEINEYQPVILEADPPYLAAFAHRAAQRGIDVFQPQLIFFTYSYPSRLHMRQIRRVFHAPFSSSHGSTETGYVFTQCEEGRFHQNVEYCRVDFLPWKRELGGPATGLLAVTALNHPWWAILRFNIGDLGRLETRGPCPCGRRLGVTLAAIAGRVKDVTLTPEGRPVTIETLDAALDAARGVVTYQFEQTAADAYVLHAVPDEAVADAEIVSSAEAALRAVYGRRASITIRLERAIVPEPSGKYRLARPRIPIATDAFLERRIAC